MLGGRRVKQAVVRRALALRRSMPQLFARGAYRPLAVSGSRARHVVAFARSLEGAHCVVVVPRLVSGLLQASDALAVAWDDTALLLPDDLAGWGGRDLLSGLCCKLQRRAGLAELLSRLPEALLVPDRPSMG